MIKIEHVVLPSPEQMEFVIEGMRNAFNSWDKSDTNIDLDDYSLEHIQIGENDLALMQKLSNGGPVNSKYMRMMIVMLRITAPLYWWKEFDTYKVGTVANSCSTMHKIQDKEFTLDDFSHEKMFNRTRNHLLLDIEELNYWRVVFLDGGGKDLPEDMTILDEDSVFYLNNLHLQPKAKKAWYQMIQLLGSNYNQTRNVMLDYEVLKNIYTWRKDHKLDEWVEFCKWIETLPYSELITGGK